MGGRVLLHSLIMVNVRVVGSMEGEEHDTVHVPCLQA